MKHTSLYSHLKSNIRRRISVIKKWYSRSNKWLSKTFPFLKKPRIRIGVLIGVGIIILAEIATVTQPFFTQNNYSLGQNESLLPKINQSVASAITYDAKEKAYSYNPAKVASESLQLNAQKISAKAFVDPKKGISVTDPVNNVDFALIPKFTLAEGKKQDNRIVYPLVGKSGWAVYTIQATGVKEDIIITSAPGDSETFEYKLGLGAGLVARQEADGSISIYGNTTLSSTITTGTEADAALLEKARKSAAKDTYLFSIPKPFVIEKDKKQSMVSSRYVLAGDSLKVVVSGLKKASYPLSIDPSIYVVTAQQFMQGNNESNINFNVDDKLIEKARTTGARFNSWDPTLNLNTSTWQQGSVAGGGYIYTAGGLHPNGGIANYTTAGTDTFVVPAGVTSTTIKSWGAGGGGGGGGQGSIGGAGGGGGFAQTTISVTAGETLNVLVGGGGGGGTSAGTNSGAGGGGGGYSGVNRSGTSLLIAAGGSGGGGGGRVGGQIGGAGGAGGGTSGQAGSSSTTSGGGGGGTSSSGGSAGTGGSNPGAAGSFLAGGAGADGRSSSGSNGSQSNGGTATGGDGGTNDFTVRYAGGGGGGAGYYGGGGGSGSGPGTNRGAGGGGGGSSYTTGSSSTNTSGSGTTPGNSSDPDRGSGGNSGSGGATNSTGGTGTGGLVIITYTGTTDAIDTVSWAKLNTTTGAIESTNPGNGVCSGWCTSTAYKLPAARSAFSMVLYNGFLYVIGGEDSTCTTGNGTGADGVCKTVYISKLGANGEPQLWHPTDANKSNWVYWYRGPDLTSPRSFTSAVAYNNRMYLVGGKTSAGGTPSIVNSVEIADIIPTGTLGSWVASGASLPYNVFGHGLQVYNDRLYIIGGGSTLGGAPLNSVYYSKLNSSGTLNSWVQTKSFTTGRISNGGNFTAIWGGYVYLNGGCSAVNASGYCTAVENTTQLASINADGSLDDWNYNASALDSRMGHSLLTWRNYIYAIGGCTTQNSLTGTCSDALESINKGEINRDGDASTVGSTSSSGTAPCSGGSPYNCDLPSSIGNILNASAIVNGYLYVMGGCTNNACTTVSTTITYQAIASDGTLQRPASCSGSYTDSYCVSSVSLPTGLAASGSTVFNGRIYLVGGFTTGTNINYVSTNSDGSLGTWASVGLSSIGAPSTLAYSYAYSRANPAAAGSIPGNLYIIGGCTAATVGCSGYSSAVSKCNINTAGVPSACSTSGQVQMQNVVVGGTNCGAGLGAMVGSVYANYVYLIGGLTPSCTDLKSARYAKIDNNNNIVTVGTGWVEGANQMNTGRRRGAGFGYNGFIYVVGGYDGTSGVLADIEFSKINVSDGSWDTWTKSAVTINQRWGLTVPISNSYAYVIGGCTSGAAPSSCATRTTTTQTFQIYNNDSGAPAAYSASANTYATNPNRIGVSSTILNGTLYVAGGCTGSVDCNSAVTNVSYASIDPYGNLGSWTNTTGSLPAARAWGKLLAAGGTLYYVGGQDTNGASQSTIYYGTPSAGNVSSWSTASNGLPASRTQFGAAVWNNRLYVVGGATGNAGTTTYASGTNSFVVPAGVSSLTVKSWGGAGGGGAGGSTAAGGTGGGGGYETATITVTPGETLSIGVGGGGASGTRNTAGGGGGGGGESGVRRGTTSLVIAAGGGGGGGGGNTAAYSGASGAAGGGATGATGSTSNSQAVGGSGGTPTTGGTGGTGGYCIGQTGALLDGGDAGEGRSTGTCTFGSGSFGGAAGSGFITGGGRGGGVITTSRAGGGGGGSGYYGGGGGSAAGTTSGGGGGGGGSSYAVTGATSVTNTAGSGINPGNASDPLLNNGAIGGDAGATGGGGTAGGTGAIILSWGSNTVTSTVYVSPAQTSGGNISSAWSTSSTSFNVARSGLVAVAYANNLYVLGGYNGSNYLSDTQFSKIDGTTGNAGSWTYSKSLPGPLAGGDGFAANGYVYIVGGRSTDTSCSPLTLVAPISANTTIASGNNPTGVGEWFQTNQAFTGSRYGNAAAYYDGKAYVMGGGCGAILSYPSTATQQTALLSQPQVARYSIMMDTDSDVFPTNWLLNGIDNSIGARWQLNYRSMTNTTTFCKTPAMTTWGIDTTFGNVTLGLPGVYTPKDASGASTNCARFYYFSVGVDSSQAFGYPDDVSRGPTITDLTLQFTADPSKRLLHGRTFTGGLQQPVDTPYYAF